jgi:GT2 family glycosyltransferase
MTDSSPGVSVVIPYWNGRRWLEGCMSALEKQTHREHKTILVDNGSMNDHLELVRRTYPGVEVIGLEKNLGFAAAANIGIKATDTSYVVLLNIDTVPEPGWLENIVASMKNSPGNVGSISSRMVRMDDTGLIDDAGDELSWYGSCRKRGHNLPVSGYTEACEVFSACAGAAVYRRSFLEDVGGFDEKFDSYLEDVDLGFRGRLLGYSCRFEPAAVVIHKGHGSAIDRRRYVYLMTRNRVMLFLKNVPASLLIKHAGNIIYGQAYFFLAYGDPISSLAGYLAVIPLLPHIFRERRRVMGRRKALDPAVDGMLSKKRDEPPLGQMISGFLQRRMA